ncbi:glycosyltransferase family protein [Cytobacillus solani]|uniref:Streptomycin biosynthesis protein StrF domain-containing protein n=1 Tax=Cytobacillus solani TaxID=1637975 RepID=A0A0Q3QNM0_9BACI|nr:glycosyltransferase family protein [Cytobacillus solani]KQL19318.1 hypothetical protein AN957_12550 [Cytobacillus solani]
MNKKKICFISCVNNLKQYKTALQYINSLLVPDGYEIETISIKQASSMTSGYNQGMKKSDAKYKVYLHQDTYILNRNFIFDIISIFEKYPKLGMLGVVGAITTPNGLWWKSPKVYGSVYHTFDGEGKIGLLSHLDVKGDYEKVRAIDGLIMITQYDLEWREDLFKGWHFYDVSQSLEFEKAGYDIGVPKQISHWCLHDTRKPNMYGYEENRRILVCHYKEYV